MPEWIDGIPDTGGCYWLRLKPTNKVSERMRKHNITCYSGMCDCHKDWVNMDNANRNRIDNGFYVVTGYIKLPEA